MIVSPMNTTTDKHDKGCYVPARTPEEDVRKWSKADAIKLLREPSACDACRSSMPYPLLACLSAWQCADCRKKLIDVINANQEIMWPIIKALDIGPKPPSWRIEGVNT